MCIVFWSTQVAIHAQKYIKPVLHVKGKLFLMEVLCENDRI